MSKLGALRPYFGIESNYQVTASAEGPSGDVVFPGSVF